MNTKNGSTLIRSYIEQSTGLDMESTLGLRDNRAGAFSQYKVVCMAVQKHLQGQLSIISEGKQCLQLYWLQQQ